MKIAKIFMKDSSSFGSSTLWGFLLLLFLILKKISIAKFIFFSLLFSFLSIYLIRFIYFKARPKPQKFKNLFEKLDASSFPSLHATRAGILIMLSYFFFKELIIFSIIISLLICISRIYLKKHYLIDIIIGFLIGVVTSYLVFLI